MEIVFFGKFINLNPFYPESSFILYLSTQIQPSSATRRPSVHFHEIVPINVWPTKLFASLIALSSSLTIATIGFVSNESGKLYNYSLSQLITWVFKPSCVISRQITKPMALSSNFVCWNNKIWETLKYFFIDHRLLYYKKKSNISVVWTVLVERKRKWGRMMKEEGWWRRIRERWEHLEELVSQAF